MHGEIGAAVEHRGLHLLDEHALAAHRLDRDVEPPIGGGLHDHEVDAGHAHGAQAGCHVLRLPARQGAAASGDAQVHVGQRSNSSRRPAARWSPRSEPEACFTRTVGA